MPLQTLRNLGRASQALKWFESYFTARVQSTRVGTSLPDQLTVTYGVPQGSILSPASFNLYMNDLPNAVQFSSVESYVDDTKIFLSFSSKDVDLSGKNHLRCFDIVFQRPYRYFSIDLKVILSLTDRYKIFTMD